MNEAIHCYRYVVACLCHVWFVLNSFTFSYSYLTLYLAHMYALFCSPTNSYPAMRPEVVSIGAVGKFVGLPTAWFSNSNAQVDYAGIGEDVHSFKPGGGLQQMSGKSA